MIAIVVSRADEASEHIGDHLLALADWDERTDDDRPDAGGGGTYYRTDGFELRTFEGLHIRLRDPAAAFDDPDLLVVVSRHSGETGPLLTAHFTGNFGPAEFGGDPGAFARAAPNAQAAVVERLAARAPEGYETGVECTHHGPTDVSVPSMFVELGSGEPQWRDPAAARAVAAAVLDLAGVDPDRKRQIVGFGGGHYAPRFERIVRETDWAVGHVAADWALGAMGSPEANRDVIERAFAASAADRAVVDGENAALRDAIEELGHRVVSETWLRETDGIDLALVAALEFELTTVDDGLRFGAAATDHGGDFETIELPESLLAAAAGVDAAAAREAVAASTLAFETREGGTRPSGRAAVADVDGGARAVDALAAVLETKYETVERTDAEVIARSVGFDPEKARDRGVPEGPAFGRLAAGDAVEVDGERVAPEDVSSERIERFDIRSVGRVSVGRTSDERGKDN